MLPSLLKRIHTDISVVPRLHYTGTKGRPGGVFRSEMKTPKTHSEMNRFE